MDTPETPIHYADERLYEINARWNDIIQLEAKIHHFKMNFEEQQKILLYRLRKAQNGAQIHRDIETFKEKVFTEPLFGDRFLPESPTRG